MASCDAYRWCDGVWILVFWWQFAVFEAFRKGLFSAFSGTSRILLLVGLDVSTKVLVRLLIHSGMLLYYEVGLFSASLLLLISY